MPESAHLQAVINVSEGIDTDAIRAIGAASGDHLLDIHSDVHHHRSVITLGGPKTLQMAQAVAVETARRIDMSSHQGVHPRFGAIDVVPFVALDNDHSRAERAQDTFGRWLADELRVPVFLYGKDRNLPDVRRLARSGAAPDIGPTQPHPKLGVTAVGARPVMVAFNFWTDEPLDVARSVAAKIRGPHLRAIGLAVGSFSQVSCNLIAPNELGPMQAYELVAKHVSVSRCELVGLCPSQVVTSTPQHWWDRLDLHPEKTIEARLVKAGLQ